MPEFKITTDRGATMHVADDCQRALALCHQHLGYRPRIIRVEWLADAYGEPAGNCPGVRWVEVLPYRLLILGGAPTAPIDGASVRGLMAIADERYPGRYVEVRHVRTSEGTYWGPGRGRMEAHRDGPGRRWLVEGHGPAPVPAPV